MSVTAAVGGRYEPGPRSFGGEILRNSEIGRDRAWRSALVNTAQGDRLQLGFRHLNMLEAVRVFGTRRWNPRFVNRKNKKATPSLTDATLGGHPGLF